MPASGGTPRPLLEPDRSRESDFHEPVAVPGGRGILFIVHRVAEGIDTIDLYADGRRRTLYQQPEAWLDSPTCSESGHLLFSRLDDVVVIWALPVGPKDLEPRGDPFLVASGASGPSVSDDGILLVSTVSRTGGQQIARVGLDGKVLAAVGDEVGHADGTTFSPDGTRLATCIFDPKRASVWVYDLERGSRVRLLADVSCGSKNGGGPEPFLATPATEEEPRISPDGRFLAYVSDESGRSEVYLRPFPRGAGRWQVSVAGGGFPRWSTSRCGRRRSSAIPSPRSRTPAPGSGSSTATTSPRTAGASVSWSSAVARRPAATSR